MKRALVLGALGLAVAAAGGCRKRPAEADPPSTRVSVQRPPAPSTGAVDWANAVYPARYADAALPAFPAEAVAATVAHATVRADFTVLPDGRAHDVRLTLESPVPEGERFVAACAATLERWRFSPAWRLARAGDPGDAAVVLLPSPARLIFHFDLGRHLEGGDVELQFGPGDR